MASHNDSADDPSANLPETTTLNGSLDKEPLKNEVDRRYGWLFRTNAGTAEEAQLSDELSLLQKQYQALMAQAQYRTCFSCLSKMPSAYLSRLENLYDSDAEQILTDDEELYQEIHDYLTLHHPEDLPKLSLYKDRLQPMSKCYSLERQLEQALQERVWLNSGGYLIIQPTEALTVIDVNSGKSEGGKNREAAFRKLNLEAAREIARQLRLRNISGIIIVDFINMEETSSEQELLEQLTRELRKDPIQTTLVDMTKLSLVEITRKKKEKSLAQSWQESMK
jgi:ribonuclease G